MKGLYKIILPLILIIGFNTQAQQRARITDVRDGSEVHKCSTDEIHAQQYANDPVYRAEYDAKKEAVSQIPYNARVSCTDPIIIPVAVHYQGVTTQSTQCLIDLALSQIAVLNEDYSASNSDVTNYCDDADNSSLDPQAIAGNGACIQFCLADQNHPGGVGLSNGQYAVTQNQNYGNFTSIWSGYLNIFVQEGTGVLGFSPLFGNANGDGIVIEACVFGRLGSGCGNGIGPGSGCASYNIYNLGRTATHEAGHYLGLNHIWGNGPESGQCGNDDGFGDTPNTEGSTYGCPSSVLTTCGTDDMTMNYMDYVNDACMYMFSEMQAQAMYNYASTKWSTTSTKCSTTPAYPAPTIPMGCDPPSVIADFSVSTTSGCEGTVVSVTNNSIGAISSYSWSFGNGNTSTSENPPAQAYPNAGEYTITLTVGDGVETDMSSVDVNIISGGTYDHLNGGDLTVVNARPYGASSGFISGTNSFDDEAKAERFAEGAAGSTLGDVEFFFETVVTNAATVTFRVWDEINGIPSTVLATVNVPKSSISTTGGTIVNFGELALNGPFYVGFELTNNAGEDIVLKSNDDGETIPTTAWERWEGGTWFPFNDYTGTGTTWEADVSLAIYADILCPASSPPVADFEADPTTVCLGEPIKFTDLSSNSPTSWSWEFGNGASSIAQNPEYTYTNAGTYTVSLTVTNDDGTDDEVKNMYVTVVEPPTGFEGVASSEEICEGESVNLSMAGTFGGAYSWETTTGSVISNNSTVTVSPTETTTYVAICEGVCRVEDEVTITVNETPAAGSVTYSGCLNDGYSILVNGTTYDQSNPTGVEELTAGASNGCDSTVTVDLVFAPNATYNYDHNGCSGDGFSISVNGEVYNEANPTGVEVFDNGASNGCDSTVNVTLSFAPNATGSFTYTSCEESGYSITVGNETFNEANPDGTATIAGGASNGCDSVVTVDLTFEFCACPPVFHTETYSGCENDGYSVMVNGQTYDASNPSGMETISGGSSNGCDSVVTISLEFLPLPALGSFSHEGCSGDGYSVLVNSETYNESNPSGTEIFAGAASNGCDSMVTVDLVFNALPEVTLSNSGGSLTATSSSTGTYQWFKDDVLIPGVTGNTYTATEGGNYYAELTDGNLCVGMSNDQTVVLSAVLDDLLDASITLYPNPVRKVLTIQFNELGSESLRLSLIDVAGRELTSRDVLQPVEHINMTNYSSGVYLLKIATSDGRVAVRKVVKD